MTRKLLSCALLTGLTLILPAVANAEIEGDFPQVVLFATNSMAIGANSTVFSGDVVVNGLTPGVELTVGNKSTFPAGWEIKADTLAVGNNVNFNGTVICNAGDALCAAGSLTQAVYGALPLLQAPGAGTTPINVPQSGSQSLSPGDYGDVTVGLEGTITFQGPGVFNIGSFTSGRKAQINVTGDWAEIRVHGDMNTGVEDNIATNAGAPDASEVIFYVDGNALLGAKTTVNANIYVAGLLELKANFTGTGAFLATDMIIGQKGKFTLDTFFDFQPEATDDTAETVEDSPGLVIDVLANDPDPEGDATFVNSFTQGAHGTVACTGGGLGPCANGDTLTYVPAPDYFGPDGFTYEVCDVDTQINEDNCAEATVTITVLSVNDPPSFVAGPDQTVNEDAGAQTVPSWATNISPGPANESAQMVSFNVSNDNNGLFSAQPAVDGSGALTYTPADDAFGSASVTVEAQDDGGTANGGDDTSAPQSFTITVISVNDPPVARDDVASTPEDTSVTIDVLANDDAGPGNELQTLTIQPFGGEAGGEAEVVGNQIQYTPAPDFFGNRVFGYTACDSGDGANDPTELCDSATVTVEVTPVNDAPTADPQSLFATATVTITLTGSDPDGDSLTFSIVSGPTKGSLGGITPIVPPGGGPVISATVDYTPDALQCSGDPLECPEDTFTFQVDDGSPPPGLSDTAIVTLNPGGDPGCTTDADCGEGFVCNTTDNVCEPAPLAVIDAKDALIADDTAYETATGEPVAITLVAAAPLAPDPNAIDDLAFTIVGGLSGGTLSAVTPIDPVTSPIRSASITFSPTCTPGGDPSICVGSFAFKACDAADSLNCDTATVEIVVSAAVDPEPPVAEDVSAAVETGSTEGVTFSLVAREGSPVACSSDDDCGEGFFCDLQEGVCEPQGGGGRPGASALAAGAVHGVDPLDNGGAMGRAEIRGPMPGRRAQQLGVPTNWQIFTWWDEQGAGGPPQPTCSGPGPMVAAATNLEGPFTFTAPAGGACLRVTDVLLTGDQFRILDSGQELATTPLVPQGGPNVGDDPDAAFASPAYSHAEVPLAAGSYSITIETIPGNSLWCGRGYLRVDTGVDNCDVEQPLLTYTVLTVPDSSFGTLLDSAGQVVSAGTVLANASLKFVATATSGTNSQTTYVATSTSTGLVSNVATVNLGVLAQVLANDCQTDEDACDKGRDGGSPLSGSGQVPADSFRAASRALPGATNLRVTVEGSGTGSVSSSRHEGPKGGRAALSCDAACGSRFVAGTEVVLFARPVGDDSEFVGWGGDCSGSEPITTVTVGRRTRCTAYFEKR